MNGTPHKQDVALVLASGGAKGFAHIGAIEALEENGYRITSLAGTSMGALIGGIYAAGGLPQVKEWMYNLSKQRILSLTDFTLSPHAIVKGDRLIKALQAHVPDCRIEELPIPFSISATDLKTGSEVVFREGSLYEAIRASISIPMLFTPVEMGDMLLVDGGLTNGLPLDQVARHEGDLLVAVNLEDYCWDEDEPTEEESQDEKSQANNLPSLLSTRLRRVNPMRKLRQSIRALSNNYLSLTYDTISVLMKRNTELALRLTPPDLYLNVQLGEYGSYDYDQAEVISQMGKEQMQALLNHYHHKGE